ncbi:MAG: hypothetical protein EOP84_27475 [Verrucomicrobiaceae bacterium]|nr:MAG: hypothetical protein EOP84_27475 [Verrucomicrobiaceae bacterium]
MRLLKTQTDEDSLSQLGEEVVELLQNSDFQSLADRFGYALTYGTDPSTAIRADLLNCLAEYDASSAHTIDVNPSVTVQYFKPNESSLFALVECVFTASNGCPVLAELIVTWHNEDQHATLEQISRAWA